MAPVTYKVKLTRPQVFLWRMSLFLILAVLLAIILDGQTGQLRHSFLANPGLNALIIGVLLVGIVYAFRQVLRLYPEINWVNNFRISDPGLSIGEAVRSCSRPWPPCSATAPAICRWPPARCARCSTRSPRGSTSSARPRAIWSACSSFSACSARSGACCRR